MKRLLVTALAAAMFCAPAFAVQAPDSAVVSGPNNEQTPLSKLIITLPGKAQTTLGAALAAAANGCTSNCTFAGITDTAGVNTTAATGFQINGVNAVKLVGPTNNTNVLLGPGAGAALPTSSSFNEFSGFNSGLNYANTGAGEVVGYGPGSCQSLQSAATHTTCIGVYSLFHATTDSGTVMVGGDSGRNMFGTGGNTGTGSYVMSNYFGSSSSAFGSGALNGNAGAIYITGTPSGSASIPITFTSTSISGGVFTLTYTEVSGDTNLDTFANNLTTAISNASQLIAADIHPVTNTSANTATVVIAYSGTSTLGTTLTISVGTITGGTSEVLTVSGGVTASSQSRNNAFGSYAVFGGKMTSAYQVNGFGAYAAAGVTTGNSINCFGDSACQYAGNGNAISIMGDHAFSSTSFSTAFNPNKIVSLGDNNGNDCNGCRNITLLGSAAGTSGIGSFADIIVLSDGSTCNPSYIYQMLVCGSGGAFIKAQNTNASATANVGFSGNVLVGGFVTDATSPLLNGDLALVKTTNTATAPGAGKLKMEVLAGTTGGTCKIVAFAGTSATPVTIVDNVGTGC